MLQCYSMSDLKALRSRRFLVLSSLALGLAPYHTLLIVITPSWTVLVQDIKVFFFLSRIVPVSRRIFFEEEEVNRRDNRKP